MPYKKILFSHRVNAPVVPLLIVILVSVFFGISGLATTIAHVISDDGDHTKLAKLWTFINQVVSSIGIVATAIIATFGLFLWRQQERHKQDTKIITKTLSTLQMAVMSNNEFCQSTQYYLVNQQPEVKNRIDSLKKQCTDTHRALIHDLGLIDKLLNHNHSSKGCWYTQGIKCSEQFNMLYGNITSFKRRVDRHIESHGGPEYMKVIVADRADVTTKVRTSIEATEREFSSLSKNLVALEESY